MRKVKGNALNDKKVSSIISLVSAFSLAMVSLINAFLGAEKSWARIFFFVLMGAFFIALVISGGAFVQNMISTKKNALNSVDTSSILERSRKVAKDLKKIVTKVAAEVDAAVKKSGSFDDARKAEVEKIYSRISSVMAGGGKKAEKSQRRLAFLAKADERDVADALDRADLSATRIIELNNAVLSSIKQIHRALLVLEQYDVRIFLGEYVLGHSSDVLERADAYIDYIGWTYALIGKTDKFKKAIACGKQILENYLATNDVSEEEKKEIKLKLIRASRHLGSDVVLARNDPEEAIKHNAEALALLEEVFSEEEKRTKGKVREMYVGVRYGILNAELFDIQKKYQKQSADKSLEKISSLVKEVREIAGIAGTFDNPHRFIKCVLLENEFLKIADALSDGGDDKVLSDIAGERAGGKTPAEAVNVRFDANTEVVDKIFKRAIYADEMMEIYINQEVTQLFRTIKEIAER